MDSVRSERTARIAFAVEAGEAGGRLDEALAPRLSRLRGQRLSKSQARKLIVVGAVALGGKTVRQPGRRLAAGARVTVVLRERARLGAQPALPFVLSSAAILYEDAVLIAVDKPAGLPTQPTVDAARDSLISAVKRWLAEHAQPVRDPGGGYLGVHQLLDRDTSGVVLFAKDPSANAGLARAFEGREVEKVYSAVCACRGGGIPQTWRVTSRLAPAAGKPPHMREVRDGGQEAVTDFEVAERFEAAVLLVARPRTGRKHQIRVQLAARGLPILGDVLYGGPAEIGGLRLPRTLLHAAELRLSHPLSGDPLKIESPLPADIRRVLARLASAARARSSGRRR